MSVCKFDRDAFDQIRNVIEPRTSVVKETRESDGVDIYVFDTSISIAISLKRIADYLEK